MAPLERILRDQAPQWMRDVHIQNEKRIEIAPDAFSEAIQRSALAKGELFNNLVEECGVREPRPVGGVTLAGDGPFVVQVRLDGRTFAPSAGRYLWGNSTTLQAPAREAAFLQQFTEAACAVLSPWHALGCLNSEYSAKNMSYEPSTMAIGVDVSRYLPGLYWLNFFSPPYCNLIGRDCLLGAPACRTAEVGEGVLVQVDAQPSDWSRSDSRHAPVLRHLGPEYFFDRDQPDRDTVAPDFGRESLPRNPRFS